MNVMKYVLILFLLNGNNGHIQYSLLSFHVHILKSLAPAMIKHVILKVILKTQIFHVFLMCVEHLKTPH